MGNNVVLWPNIDTLHSATHMVHLLVVEEGDS